MSDPSIQTFCCHKPGTVSPSLAIMATLNSNTYNVICLISSAFGCLGAAYQLLPREETHVSRRWFSLTSQRGRQIVVWLAVADLLASLGVFMRSTIKLNDSFFIMVDGEENIMFCVLMAAWVQYFYVVTWLWTLLYAIDTWLALHQKPGLPKFYHIIAWALPALLTSVGLAVLYYPDADCHSFTTLESIFIRLLPNYIITYFVICTVMVLNPIFYFSSGKLVDVVVTNCLCQMTRKERTIIQAVRVRFGLINLAFYICWLPNLINGIIVWTTWENMPKEVVLTLWYIMALMNPLQALFNSFVYRRSNMKIIHPFRLSSPVDEATPLLVST